MPKLEVVSRSMCLVIQGWKLCRNPMAACAITTVTHYGFEWFHFFHLVTEFVSGVLILGFILTPFGDLGGTFSDF